MPTPLAVRAVLIDLDGTLLDTVLDLHAAANAMLRDLGRAEVAVESIRSYVGRGIPNLVKRVLAGSMDAADDAAPPRQRLWPASNGTTARRTVAMPLFSRVSSRVLKHSRHWICPSVSSPTKRRLSPSRCCNVPVCFPIST
jgi:phosphoglycolate phosphatase-like HAD superfamily hydrolase